MEIIEQSARNIRKKNNSHRHAIIVGYDSNDNKIGDHHGRAKSDGFHYGAFVVFFEAHVLLFYAISQYA